MNVVLNGELFEEVEYFKYLRTKISVDGGKDRWKLLLLLLLSSVM